MRSSLRWYLGHTPRPLTYYRLLCSQPARQRGRETDRQAGRPPPRTGPPELSAVLKRRRGGAPPLLPARGCSASAQSACLHRSESSKGRRTRNRRFGSPAPLSSEEVATSLMKSVVLSLLLVLFCVFFCFHPGKQDVAFYKIFTAENTKIVLCGNRSHFKHGARL